MKNCRLLIIGKKPLPIGGVTRHVQRLTEWLNDIGYNYEFYDLEKFNIISMMKAIRLTKYAHLHCSSPMLHYMFAILCRAYDTRSIITYHCNLGEDGRIKKQLRFASVKLACYPITLNQKSYEIGLKYNNNTLLQSAYLPDCHVKNDIKEETARQIKTIKLNYKIVCSTNAFNWLLDNNGQEIYCISQLMTFFDNHKQWALLISDPSGNCRKHFVSIPANILFISYPHNFINILQESDCFLRYTLSDGDSLSIHEAMDKNVPVIATDVVPRPKGTTVVPINDMVSLENAISNVSMLKAVSRKIINTNYSIPDIISFYENLV